MKVEKTKVHAWLQFTSHLLTLREPSNINGGAEATKVYTHSVAN